MQRSTERILTTHCGLLPPPSVMGDLMAAKAGGQTDRAASLIAGGVSETLSRQAEIGIDLPSDGEFYKNAFTDYDYYAGRVDGLEHREAGDGEQVWFGDKRSPEMLEPRFQRFFEFADRVGMFPDSGWKIPFTHRFVIAEPLRYRGPDAINAELAAVREGLDAVGLRPQDVFYPQLSPGWLGHFLWNEAYASDEEYVYGIAEAWKGEYEAIVQAGFNLQIDDPALADKYYMFNPPLSVEDYRKHQQLRIEATNHALSAIPEDRVRYHVCWGSWHYPHTTDIAFEHIVDLLLQINAGTYLLEASNVRHQLDHKVWETVGLPEGKVLVPGVVGHATSNLVEAPQLVADRLITYARIVGRENVMAGTDCGLGLRCHEDVVWAKLASLVEGAQLASEVLWSR